MSISYFRPSRTVKLPFFCISRLRSISMAHLAAQTTLDVVIMDTFGEVLSYFEGFRLIVPQGASPANTGS
jgi:hypothetical protein